ncbi:uncharacterized protein EV420DRAFT_1556153 [Desarmillaria tabescens]|uniref:DUF1640-domain-containing protein n=1 Tax=Armillaria tabescens TaxID=1929756 RepID=A0AA39K5U0_ARMTA|nr:uncharacterized protein EV420DRAFT_1556153 [Desarmillaria tabescens]KAK0453990.1 hypothetical protein EV420DRAFT_1556153 [Desarmillaria tabescens]
MQRSIASFLSLSTWSAWSNQQNQAWHLAHLRRFSTSRPRHDFHFDTHHFVQRLEREGLNRAQAEGIMSAIAEVIDESIRNMTSNMVTKADQEKPRTTGLLNDIEKLKQRLREEITRTQAGVRLDLNLEKGRLREDSAGQVLKIREVDTRIEQEIASLRTAIQASKATTLQYIVGVGELYDYPFLHTVYYPLSHDLFRTSDGLPEVPGMTIFQLCQALLGYPTISVVIYIIIDIWHNWILKECEARR